MRTGLGKTKIKKVRKEGSGKTKKYTPLYDNVAEEACAIGANINQLAAILNVHQPTVNNWMKEYPNFYQCVIRGRDRFAVEHVESALLKRAKGYSYIRKVDRVTKSGVIKCAEEMHVPADTTAAIFFLINRNPHRWKSINRFQQMNVFGNDGIQHDGKNNGKDQNGSEYTFTPDSVREIISALHESGAIDERQRLLESETAESTEAKIN